MMKKNEQIKKVSSNRVDRLWGRIESHAIDYQLRALRSVKAWHAKRSPLDVEMLDYISTAIERIEAEQASIGATQKQESKGGER